MINKCMSIFQLRCNRVHWKEFTTFYLMWLTCVFPLYCWEERPHHPASEPVLRLSVCLMLRCLSEAAVFIWGCGVCLRLRCLSEAAVFFSEAAVFIWGCDVYLRPRCLSEAAVFVCGCGVYLRLRCLSEAAVFVWGRGVCLRPRCLYEAAVFVWGRGVCMRLRFIWGYGVYQQQSSEDRDGKSIKVLTISRFPIIVWHGYFK